MSYRAQIGATFEVLAEGLAPFVDRRMSAYITEDEWILTAAAKLGKREDFLVTLSDPQFQLDVLNRFWGPVFARDLDSRMREVVNELRTARNHWAHINDDQPLDLDDALRVNQHVEDLLRAVGADDAERIEALNDELRWVSVRADSRSRGVSETEALMQQLADLQAERGDLAEKLAEAREDAQSASGRGRAVARQLAELQTQYAAVAGLRERYVALQRQLRDARSAAEEGPGGTVTLTDHAHAHAHEDTDAALEGLHEESAELRRKLQEARAALESLDPAQTPIGQRWMWLVAGLLVTLCIVILMVATAPNAP